MDDCHFVLKNGVILVAQHPITRLLLTIASTIFAIPTIFAVLRFLVLKDWPHVDDVKTPKKEQQLEWQPQPTTTTTSCLKTSYKWTSSNWQTLSPEPNKWYQNWSNVVLVIFLPLLRFFCSHALDIFLFKATFWAFLKPGRGGNFPHHWPISEPWGSTDKTWLGWNPGEPRKKPLLFSMILVVW